MSGISLVFVWYLLPMVNTDGGTVKPTQLQHRESKMYQEFLQHFRPRNRAGLQKRATQEDGHSSSGQQSSATRPTTKTSAVFCTGSVMSAKDTTCRKNTMMTKTQPSVAIVGKIGSHSSVKK